MQQITPNLFETLKSTFQHETGKKWNENIEIYCHYVIAKNSCAIAHLIVDIRNSIEKIESKIFSNIP